MKIALYGEAERENIFKYDNSIGGINKQANCKFLTT